MTSAQPEWPSVTRRCTWCTREAVVVVATENNAGTVAVCREHLEWAFFIGVDAWTGRRRTA